MSSETSATKLKELEKENEELRALVVTLRTWQAGFEKTIRELRVQGTSSSGHSSSGHSSVSVDDVD